MKTIHCCFLALAAAWIFACAPSQQIDLLEREQRRLRADTNTMQADLDAMRGTLADTRANMQQLQREMNVLRERVDETRIQVGRQIGETTREGDQRVRNLESRLAKLEEELKAQGDVLKAREESIAHMLEGQQKPVPPADGLAEGAAAESDTIRRDYEAAWRSLDKKEYKAAIGRFREFIKKYPKSTLAGNAQYWIGESLYALKEFDQAIIEFDAVRRRYPQGEKVPAALLKQGFAFAELGEKLNARLILQEVVEKYPQSPEAGRAKQRLKSLES
ncbi:MAG TPA: tol-pal system protein YbgF [Candidatus Binatia bacterium]|nr:tol-pal system protein YbgF [Candidatus Binatia bacterium]